MSSDAAQLNNIKRLTSEICSAMLPVFECQDMEVDVSASPHSAELSVRMARLKPRSSPVARPQVLQFRIADAVLRCLEGSQPMLTRWLALEVQQAATVAGFDIEITHSWK